jgi:trans-aconitate methyltransferase
MRDMRWRGSHSARTVGAALTRGVLPDPHDIEIDYGVAHAVRMYDYLVGGTSHFEADRLAVEQAASAVGGIQKLRAGVQSNEAFLGRVVRWLMGPGGVRQFLDVGSGIPRPNNAAAVARQLASEARVVCVDNDPIVLAHAHQLVEPEPSGAAAFVVGDLREVDGILAAAADYLNLSQPVAVLLVAVLHLIPDGEDPYGIVGRLVDALPPGSYLAVSHLTADLAPEAMAALAEQLSASARETFVLRDHAGVSGFLEGLDLIRPGVVPVDRWRPLRRQGGGAEDGRWVASLYGGLGRRPRAGPSARW